MRQFERHGDGRVSFGDGKEWAKIVRDSVGEHGRRVVSVETHYWRMIHSEIMTHRDRARSSASSRAIPFYREERGDVSPKCMYGMVSSRPFVPEFIGAEQRGMQSGAEIEGADREATVADITELRDHALRIAKLMSDRGVHKSICNRYLEPWMYITVLMTATEWANFFRLRVHPKAEKHFDKMARLVREAIRQSEPDQLSPGQWHLPYIRSGEQVEIHDALYSRPHWLAEGDYTLSQEARAEKYAAMISAGRCARLSYLTQDGKRDFGEDVRLFRQLIDPKREDGGDDDAIHAAAIEHTCRCHADPNHRSGPFLGWHQLRKDYPRENVPGIGPLE